MAGVLWVGATLEVARTRQTASQRTKLATISGHLELKKDTVVRRTRCKHGMDGVASRSDWEEEGPRGCQRLRIRPLRRLQCAGKGGDPQASHCPPGPKSPNPPPLSDVMHQQEPCSVRIRPFHRAHRACF